MSVDSHDCAGTDDLADKACWRCSIGRSSRLILAVQHWIATYIGCLDQVFYKRNDRHYSMEHNSSIDTRIAVPNDLGLAEDATAARSDFDLNDLNDRQENSSELVTYPEGGVEAWLVVTGAFCALFLVFGIVSSTSVFQAYLSSHQLRDESPVKIAWIFSVNLFLTFFCGIYSGSAFDRSGPRILVAVGSLALITSMFLLGLCRGECEAYELLDFP
nr:putative transporter mch4 [Quercus suber]